MVSFGSAASKPLIVIEDDKKLQVENVTLYEKIKNRIKNEFTNDMPSNFDTVFDTFIQNTFVHKSDLQLAAYENQTKGEFFNHLADKNIPTNTANLIFQQLSLKLYDIYCLQKFY